MKTQSGNLTVVASGLVMSNGLEPVVFTFPDPGEPSDLTLRVILDQDESAAAAESIAFVGDGAHALNVVFGRITQLNWGFAGPTEVGTLGGLPFYISLRLNVFGKTQENGPSQYEVKYTFFVGEDDDGSI